MLSILFGLAAALGWGAADFTGGLASRKIQAHRAVLYGELVGIVALVGVVIITGESVPGLRSALLAVLAGMVGTIGLLFLYHSMTLGLMSIATPVSALLAAVFPVVIGAFTEGFPGWLTVFGFGFALFAVWMISQGEGGVTDILAHIADLKLPLLAGVGFGLYFVIMHQATKSGETFFPMMLSRSGGSLLIAGYMTFTRMSWKVEDKSAWWIILLNGVLDVCGNAFFILAGQTGRLDVAAVLSSLFPGGTVLLAWIFLRERLSRGQWVGVLSALVAIVLMTVNAQMICDWLGICF